MGVVEFLFGIVVDDFFGFLFVMLQGMKVKGDKICGICDIDYVKDVVFFMQVVVIEGMGKKWLYYY